MTYLITFHTHSGALSMSRHLQSQGLDAKMMPVPRAVSSSCGTGVRVICDDAPRGCLNEDVDAVFAQQNGGWVKVFEQTE